VITNELGNTGIRISALSFGSMRWLSEEACYAVVQRGLDLGMNYIDTSTGYVGGQSEVWSGHAVKARRSEIYFASKSHWAQAPRADAVRRAIEGSLEKTGLDSFDFYHVWGLQSRDVLDQALAPGGTIEGIRKAQRDGLVTVGIGFTFHGDAELFRAAVDSGEFLCTTVSYNLMNRKAEPWLDYAAANGVGTIIMNPLAGGMLATRGGKAPDFLCDGDRGPWYGALRFLLANPSITTSIIGFKTLHELEEDVQALEGAEALDESYRLGLITQMAATKLPEGDFCTGCGYCRDCPHGFDPTRFMQAMRDFHIQGLPPEDLPAWLQAEYMGQNPQELLAQCTECLVCEETCPQHLPIAAEIRKAKAALD